MSVEVAGRTMMQEVAAGTSFLSMDSQSLRFGLGETGTVSVVRVAWPSGREEWFFTEGVVDRIMRLVEGEGSAPVAGDVNFDGKFDTSDLIEVFQQGEYEDGVSLNSRWTSGDWNGDREFDTGDLITALAAGTFETTAARGISFSDLAAAVDSVWQSAHARRD